MSSQPQDDSRLDALNEYLDGDLGAIVATGQIACRLQNLADVGIQQVRTAAADVYGPHRLAAHGAPIV